jgi:hypothetical protein
MSASGLICAFPATRRTAQRLANALRARGFFTLRERTWSGTADLAELLKEREPTVAQLAWLRWAHQDFLETTQ